MKNQNKSRIGIAFIVMSSINAIDANYFFERHWNKKFVYLQTSFLRQFFSVESAKNKCPIWIIKCNNQIPNTIEIPKKKLNWIIKHKKKKKKKIVTLLENEFAFDSRDFHRDSIEIEGWFGFLLKIDSCLQNNEKLYTKSIFLETIHDCKMWNNK